MNIEVRNLVKNFQREQVIRDVSFTIASGEMTCLLGPSGSGKTTLIRLLIGAIVPEAGTIKIGGEWVPQLKLLKKIGFMPQADALYDDLSGEDNLKFFAELYGLKKEAISQRCQELLTLLDLVKDRKKLVRNYSGGMKKRLSLGIALIHQPDILLLDEPTVGIDPVLRRSIWRELQTLGAQGKTILVSTHVMDEVEQCEKVALLYKGKLIEHDFVSSVLSKTQGRVEDLFFQAVEQDGGDLL